MTHDSESTNPTILSTHHRIVGQPLLAELEQYWRDLRGARCLPVRTEVNPAQIDAVLPHSFILERVAPGEGRLRIAGQELNNLLGMETRGMPLSVFFSVAARPVLSGWLERVFSGPALLELPLVSSRGLARSRLTGRMLVLPLLGNDGTVSRALGAIMVDGVTGRGAHTFNIPQAGAIRCEMLDQKPANRMRVIAGQGASGGCATADRAHLRLVVSNG